MKKTVILLALFLTLFSCKEDYSTLTEFTLKNESGYELRIEVSNFETMSHEKKDTTFIIEPNAQISHQYKKEGANNSYGFPFGAASKNITIHFNDSISVFFNRITESSYNPLMIDNYFGGMITEGFCRYTYTFTELDIKQSK